MRNVETAAINGMNTIIVGTLDGFRANVKRYHELWETHQGKGALTTAGTEPKIGLVVHLYVADTDEEAASVAGPAWEEYRWNLGTPRRLEAEKRGLDQFLGDNAQTRPANLPDRDAQRDLDASLESLEREQRGALGDAGGTTGAGFGVLAGSPETVREYMDDYVKTSANYLVCSFQWGNLTHEQAMRSVALFSAEVMPHYVQ